MSEEKTQELQKFDDMPLAQRGVVERIARFVRMARSGEPGDMFSYDPTTPDGAVMHLMANLSEVPDLSSLVNKTIKVANFLMHDASRENRLGELDEWKRIVIFDEQNQPYSCGSSGVAKSLITMFPIFGMMPWSPPVECDVKIKKLSDGKQWMTIVPTKAMLDRITKRKK